jgi:hypothetical protein
MSLNNLNNEMFAVDPLVATVFKKIPKSDVKCSLFFAYKTWTIPSGSSSNLITPLKAKYCTTQTLLTSGALANKDKNANGSLQTVTYHSINNLVYKRKNQPYHTYGGTNLNNTKKALYESASILSFPYAVVGEGIKPASFTFNIPGTASLKSDNYGNIYDTGIDTSSIISNTKFYEGFNEYFDSTRISNVFKSLTADTWQSYSGGTMFQSIEGVPTTSGTQKSVGYAARFNNVPTDGVATKINGSYNKTDDYSVSFWIYTPTYKIAESHVVGLDSNPIYQNGIAMYRWQGDKYPFDIVLTYDRIKFEIASDSSNRTYMYSVTSIPTASWTHVVCQKTGSNIELYINGTFNTSASSASWINKTDTSISKNINELTIGNKIYQWNYKNSANTYQLTRPLNGSIDELRIYNKALSVAQISLLNNRNETTGSFLQTNIVGTVFHKHGLAVISSPLPKYNNILNSNYTTTHNSTKRLYEFNVLTRVLASEFNMSTNMSLLTTNTNQLQSFTTGSDFSPYITTIGLYNKHGQLLAVGKLGQAIKKRDDVNMNFVIRIDLDMNIPGK